MSARPSEAARLLSFDLAIQRDHLLVYTLALLTTLAGWWLGVFPLRIEVALVIWALACTTAIGLYFLYRRGVDRRCLNPLWMATDIFFVTLAVYATGGIASPWYIWYVATASSAAFAAGKRAAYAVTIANTIAYVGILVLMGQATLTNDVLLLAFTRMLFVGGASYFFLVGIANLQEKRLRIRQLEAAESRKVDELTRVTDELAEANRRIREADRLKSQFLANMSHELRTPMNSIIGFSEILVERLDGRIEPKHVGFLKHINDSGRHLLAIINDILDLSKIEAGKMEVCPERFPIKPVVESVCQVVRGMTRDAPPFVRPFVINAPDDLPEIETDPAKFKQILFNLISNAVKFSPADQPITIEASHADGTITLTVRDRGIGIDPEHHALIFEEFRQVDGTARREFGGTGLGLALVKKFVELQGGRVTLDSRLGEGSAFSFTLPLRSRAAVITRPLETAPPPVRADRVLVVEDDPHAYELIASALGSAGFLPIRASRAAEALRLACESRPIAVTLDLVLPDGDGWELLRQLKSDPATRELPVVVISMLGDRELGIALGADDYFVKPVDRERLLARLRELAPRGRSTAQPRLLVIDDDASVHALVAEDLAGLGYAIESAFSGDEGLRAALESAPNVILLDLMMPNMSGFEVAAALKGVARTADIPIVVLTSKEVSSDDRHLLHAKVTTVVQKGASARDQLVRELRRVTAQA